MYLPKMFVEDELVALHDLIDGRIFGLIIIVRQGVPDVAHIPFLLDRGEGAHGRLRGHFARPNSIWRAFDGKAEALAVFAGPDTYISPDWYVSPNQVPTWNYIAVHAVGRPKVIADDAEVRRVLEDLSAQSESRIQGKKPWTVDKLSDDFYTKMRQGIVAFEMPIERIEGKWKVGQNRAPADRIGAASALEALDDPNARAIARLMREV